MHTFFEQMHQTTATTNWKQLQLHTCAMKPEPKCTGLELMARCVLRTFRRQ
jgi:hypothetical protein